jgi:hypothetical protein
MRRDGASASCEQQGRCRPIIGARPDSGEPVKELVESKLRPPWTRPRCTGRSASPPAARRSSAARPGARGDEADRQPFACPVAGRRLRPLMELPAGLAAQLGRSVTAGFQGAADGLRRQQDTGQGDHRQAGGVPGGREGVAGASHQEGRQGRGGAAEQRARQAVGERQPAVAKPRGEQLGQERRPSRGERRSAQSG